MISQEIGMLLVRPVSCHTVRRRLFQHPLSKITSVSLNYAILRDMDNGIEYRNGRMSSFSDEYRFCVQNFDRHTFIWRIRGDRMSPTCIRYRYRGPTLGVIIWNALRTR